MKNKITFSIQHLTNHEIVEFTVSGDTDNQRIVAICAAVGKFNLVFGDHMYLYEDVENIGDPVAVLLNPDELGEWATQECNF